jgi:hypothetical protein
MPEGNNNIPRKGRKKRALPAWFFGALLDPDRLEVMA